MLEGLDRRYGDPMITTINRVPDTVLSKRQYWAPYFDDMDAIIFLVPLSCFDQVLAEDEEVNRLVRISSSTIRTSRTLKRY
jgi:hypothetical protein